MKTECEILIIGAGPAGSTLARELSKHAIDNILVQRNFNFKKPCGGGVRVDAFDEFGLDKKYIKKDIHTIILAFKEKRISVDIHENPLAIVERREFDSYLRDEAKNAGSVVYEATFIDVQIQEDCVLSSIKIGNEIKTIKSKYLVAADGVNSKIRKMINKDQVPSLMTNYADLNSLACTDCEFHFGEEIASKEYAWSFPEANGTNIGTLSRGDTPYMSNFENSLGVDEEHKIYGYKIPKYDKALFYKTRVFFVGDSATQVLPFTYEGIYYAMSSAKILAEVLAQRCEPDEYEKRWNKKYLRKFQTLKKLQQIFLYNDFMVALMMRMYQSKSIQEKMIDLWLRDRKVTIDFMFFMRLLVRLLTSRPKQTS
ncbi:NAD(P)/FAD-dependent oxidoreductase [bacterium]|nr:NAD(P)/FAD-dependent oxidoreductase [bacterium]MBU1989816.1 NAD(P)/FAD-dependent oxidoreductase [bacterium]